MNFGKIFSFWKKKDQSSESDIDLKPLPDFPKEDFIKNSFPRATPPLSLSSTDMNTENLRAKIDLMVTQLDSMRIQYESLNERIVQIEKMVKEILDMAKS
jgi:hypothetical protein